jgi:two-component system, NarL family, response regulator NreC
LYLLNTGAETYIFVISEHDEQPGGAVSAGSAAGAGDGGGPKAISVVLADGEELVRSGLQRLLDDEQGLKVVAVADGAEEAVRYASGHRPDVLVVSPGDQPEAVVATGLLSDLASVSPGTSLIVLSGNADPRAARDTLRDGAMGFVLRTEGQDALVEAIRRAARGEPYVNARLGVEMAKLERLEDDLTDRETQVLRLIALGFTNSEIGDQLGLSVRTVETHRAHIMAKLDFDSRSQIVRYAIDNGLLP